MEKSIESINVFIPISFYCIYAETAYLFLKAFIFSCLMNIANRNRMVDFCFSSTTFVFILMSSILINILYIG